MDVSTLLDGLNDKQRDAVAAPLQPAGAGRCRFGQDRVLVHRIAWLMQVERCSPFSIIAVTFTNKAAAEMRGRVEKVIGDGVRGMWIGTFHGIAHRLLRAHHLDAGLPQDFQILDSDDQYRLIRRVLKALNLDEKHWAPRAVMGYINGKKDEGLRPGDIDLYGDPVTRTYQQIYQDLPGDLRSLRAWWILQNSCCAPTSCGSTSRTSSSTTATASRTSWWTSSRIPTAFSTPGCGCWRGFRQGDDVGDDDQSIYGWRGAKIENIQRFLTDYQGPRPSASSRTTAPPPIS